MTFEERKIELLNRKEVKLEGQILNVFKAIACIFCLLVSGMFLGDSCNANSIFTVVLDLLMFMNLFLLGLTLS